MAKQQQEQKGKEKKNILEWIVLSTSLMLLLCVLGYLVYKTYTHETSPPDIQVEFASSPTEITPFRYHMVIKNTGGETAEEVRIELVLKRDGLIIEKAELMLSFVPQASEREGWLNFSHDPRDADTITARVISFKKP